MFNLLQGFKDELEKRANVIESPMLPNNKADGTISSITPDDMAKGILGKTANILSSLKHIRPYAKPIAAGAAVLGGAAALESKRVKKIKGKIRNESMAEGYELGREHEQYLEQQGW